MTDMFRKATIKAGKHGPEKKLERITKKKSYK